MTDANTIALTPESAGTPATKIRRTSLLRLMLPLPGFRWHTDCSAQRAEVESYITDKFRTEYDAEVSTFAPLLLSMHCKNQLSAAVGIRPASAGPLFVEQYLDTPIEQSIAAAEGETIQRDEIVEIGNLVATRRGASQLLFIVLGAAMYEAGYRWLAFSATKKVERMTRKFPFPVQVLCASDPKRLGDHASEWGHYYDTNPHVIIGDIRVAYEKAQQNRLLRIALKFYRPLLRRLVRSMPAVI